MKKNKSSERGRYVSVEKVQKMLSDLGLQLCKGRKHLGPGILPPCGLVGALVELAAQEAVVIAAVRQDPDSEIGVTVIAGDPTFGIKAHVPRHREDVGIVRGICHAPGIDLVSDAVALKAVL